MSHDRLEVIKNFTRGRKFPQLIGRTPDGKKIYGGPYTLPQVVGGGVAALILWVTRPLWLGGLVWNVGFALAVVLGTVFALGKLRLGGRSPASVLQGVVRALVVPREAKINGRTVRPRRAHLVHAGGRIHPASSEVEQMRVAADSVTVSTGSDATAPVATAPVATGAAPVSDVEPSAPASGVDEPTPESDPVSDGPTPESDPGEPTPVSDGPTPAFDPGGGGAAAPRRARSSVKELLALASSAA